MPLLWKSSLRYLQRHPWLVALSILGVALGVGVVVAIDLANASANQAFSLSADAVAGRATHQVVGPATGISDSVYVGLRVEEGLRPAAPVVEGYVRLQDQPFRVLGIDPLAEGPFRPFAGPGTGVDLGVFMAGGGAVLVTAPAAERAGWAVGDTLSVGVQGVPRQLFVAGLLEPADATSRRAMSDLLVTDVSTAQGLFGMQGRLSRIDLILPSDEEGLLARFVEVLPEGVEVVRSASRTETLEQMADAFSLNLRALSLLALVVGMFLIYNTMTFSVVRRRSLLGRLRALGITRQQVFRLVLAESLLIGAAGSLLGLALGVLLGQGLVRLVTQTINDLYFVVSVTDLTVAPATLVKGILLGIGATAVATIAPAREAARAPVSSVLQRSVEESTLRRRIPALSSAGVAFGLLGAMLLLLPVRSIVLSYAALLCILAGFALLVPAFLKLLAAGLRPLMGRLFGVVGRMAARGVVATLSRTAVATAALAIAVAAAVGVGIMVGSFRTTVETWLNYTLQADVYVQPPSLVFRRGDATLDRDLARQLAEARGVAGSSSVRHLLLQTDEGAAELAAIEFGPRHRSSFRFQEGRAQSVWEALGEGGVIVSEPYSYRRGVSVGDTLELPTDRGLAAFVVHGVYYDYGSDVGTIMMSRGTYDRFFDDRGVSGIAFYAAEGQDVDALVERLRRMAASADQQVYIRSNRGLREASLDVFDRSFTITSVLRILAVIVAFIGILSALMALQLERVRELAVLRAEGMTPRQLWHYVTLQTGVMGLAAGILSLPIGLILAVVLVYVINKRSFGWTLQLDVSPEVLLQALLVAVGAAVIAGLYPSLKMARSRPADALRVE